MSEYNSSTFLVVAKKTSRNYLTLPLVPPLECLTTFCPITSILPALYHFLSLLGILGNLCSVWACLRPSRPWSVGTVGVLNLALCDLAFLVSMQPWGVYLGSGYHWGMSQLACMMVSVLCFVGLTTSTMFICAISADRFLAVTFPLESRLARTPRNATLVSMLLWAVTFLLVYLTYPNILYWERHDGTRYCGVLIISRLRYHRAAYSLLSYYVVQVSAPIILVVPSYVKILIRLRQMRQQRGSAYGRDKTTCLTAAFIATFLTCWVPGQLLLVCSIVVFFTLDASACWVVHVVNLLTEISQMFYSLNACLNPIIFHVQQGLCASWWKRRMWREEVKNQTPLSSGACVSVVQLQLKVPNKTFLK